jgi:hypothetical protein
VCEPRAKYVHWPSVGFSSRSSHLCIVLAELWGCSNAHNLEYLHAVLDKSVHELVLALSHLNDLLEQTRLDLSLDLCDLVDCESRLGLNARNLCVLLAQIPLQVLVHVLLHILACGTLNESLLAHVLVVPLGSRHALEGLGLPHDVEGLLAGRSRDGDLAESLRVRVDDLLYASLPFLEAGGLDGLDDAQAVLCESLGGLAVDAVLGEGLELLEGVVVDIEEGGAWCSVDEETGQTSGRAGLEILGGLCLLHRGEEAEGGSHGCERCGESMGGVWGGGRLRATGNC